MFQFWSEFSSPISRRTARPDQSRRSDGITRIMASFVSSLLKSCMSFWSQWFFRKVDRSTHARDLQRRNLAAGHAGDDSQALFPFTGNDDHAGADGQLLVGHLVELAASSGAHKQLVWTSSHVNLIASGSVPFQQLVSDWLRPTCWSSLSCDRVLIAPQNSYRAEDTSYDPNACSHIQLVSDRSADRRRNDSDHRDDGMDISSQTRMPRSDSAAAPHAFRGKTEILPAPW